MSVRVVHEGTWTGTYPGGSERLAREIARALDAPVTVGHSEHPEFWDDVDAEIEFQELNRPPLKWLPIPVREFLLGMKFRTLEFEENTIISSGTTAKWWSPRTDQRHIHYCHSPPPQVFVETSSNIVESSLKTGAGMVDQFYARLCDVMVSNSEFTADRVRQYYGNDTEIIHPPIDTSGFHHDEPADETYLVMVGRINEMKRTALVARAFDELDERLVIVGDGPLRDECEWYSGVRVTSELSDFALQELIARSTGGVAFAEREHCGMTPKEFQAAGKPVIVPDEPNLHNHVQNGNTGVIVPGTEEGVQEGVRGIMQHDWDHEAIQNATAEWSTDRFRRKIRELVEANGRQVEA